MHLVYLSGIMLVIQVVMVRYSKYEQISELVFECYNFTMRSENVGSTATILDALSSGVVCKLFDSCC